MAAVNDKPVIIQSDRSILLETDSPAFEDARDSLALFAELVKSPEHIHTYRLTALSLWNAAAAGITPDQVMEALERFTKYDIPQNVTAEVRDTMARYGRLKLYRELDGRLALESDDPLLVMELLHQKLLQPYIQGSPDGRRIFIKPEERGNVKCALVKLGFPAEDLAGYADGAPLEVSLRDQCLSGRPFGLRKYQRESVDAFYAGGANRGGSGVVVLPCGAGKTVVAIGVMAAVKMHTLILTTNTVALRQWKAELVDKTSLREDEIGEYSGDSKTILPVTIATYQVLTFRKSKDSEFIHFSLFDEGQWGLIVYDEVHLLPAPVFKLTAELQARRRIGLTATLVREDGREGDVFSLIGPKRYDAAWKDIEAQGFIAPAACFEVRVELPESERFDYSVAEDQDRYRIAASASVKQQIAQRIVDRHPGESVLVIGQYIDQLEAMAEALNCPLITGQTPVDERERLFNEFREGRERLLVVSKVANFSVDLPDASVAIQISGSFGSRQEEAQRLGRLLRPKSNGASASFYTLVTRDTVDQDFAQNRQRFLAEQGYAYTIMNADEL